MPDFQPTARHLFFLPADPKKCPTWAFLPASGHPGFDAEGFLTLFVFFVELRRVITWKWESWSNENYLLTDSASSSIIEECFNLCSFLSLSSSSSSSTHLPPFFRLFTFIPFTRFKAPTVASFNSVMPTMLGIHKSQKLGLVESLTSWIFELLYSLSSIDHQWYLFLRLRA